MDEKIVYQHWQLETDANQFLWLRLDKADASTNTLNESVLAEFEAILDSLPQQPQLRGLAIMSAKASGFIAGADIEQFTKLHTQEDAMALIRRGQALFQKLANLSLPTVAVIEGFCLGGGLELALACRYRVVEESDKTKLGLPEVLLGIHPGWGGTVRLPRLIGAFSAMDLILTGRTIPAKTAAKLGLVDAAVPKRQLQRAAVHYLLEKPQPRQASSLQQLTNYSLVRPLIAKFFSWQLSKKIKQEHYPAPYAVVDNWQQDELDDEAAMRQEAQSLAKLQAHDTAKNLIRVYYLQERLKAQGKEHKFKTQRVHVVGAGTMGGDIAAWCALLGLQVTLQDREAKFIAPAIKRAYQLFKKRLKQPRLVQQAMDRLLPDPHGHGIAKADLIIEAIYENLAAKQALFQQLEAIAKPDAILASNTSSIPLDEINTVLQQPGRLVGIHFFNPVARMQLVEVVKGDKTSPEVVQKAMAFVHCIDRLPLAVKSSPGFLVNRILMPYLMEAMQLLSEGVPGPAIDQTALDFGMPMGPVELADTVGLDVCLSVAENLSQYYGGVVPERLRNMVKNGELGRKSGKGFYLYKNGKPVKSKQVATTLPTETIRQRLILRLLNEAMACLHEQVVEDSDLLDAGMIFGTGFAPFYGGPMNYLNTIGKPTVYAQLQQLAQQHGERFKPNVGWL